MMELSGSNAKNEKDAITQLRNEFKAASKNLRNDICRKKSTHTSIPNGKLTTSIVNGVTDPKNTTNL